MTRVFLMRNVYYHSEYLTPGYASFTVVFSEKVSLSDVTFYFRHLTFSVQYEKVFCKKQ